MQKYIYRNRQKVAECTIFMKIFSLPGGEVRRVVLSDYECFSAAAEKFFLYLRFETSKPKPNMIQTGTFDDFCRDHYDEAVKYADLAVASHVSKYGKLDRRMDVEKVKSLAVLSALEKAFQTFDPTKNVKLSSYLSLLVSRDVQSELAKE